MSTKNRDKKQGPEMNYFVPDMPITREGQDLFRYKDFVDVIKYALEHMTPPLNIALYGSWGVGKSSILNLLKEELGKDEGFGKKYQYVYIDAWKLSPESLRQELLQELNQQFSGVFSQNEIEDRLWNVREEYSERKMSIWKKILDGFVSIIPYGALLGAIVVGGIVVGYYTKKDLTTETFFASIIIPMLGALVMRFKSISNDLVKTTKRVIPRVESSHQFEDIFNKIIKHKKSDKLIIAIDNLDRCEDEAVVKILGTLKTFMNRDDCVYIIPCDEKAIIKHILSVRGDKYYQERDAIEFLNKFFQITIRIPPFIEGDLEGYVGKEIEKFGELGFDTKTRDVLILGITKNPRKIRQYLYDLVILYKIAQAREPSVVQKGILTGNTEFLAKIIVLRAEWPDFYRRLEVKEDLLELLEKHYFGESTGELSDEEIKEIKEQNPGLEWFLRRTQLVSTPNISAFIKLNQEIFESTIADLNSFVLKINQGESDSVRADLEKISENDRQKYIEEGLKRLDDYMQNDRLQFAFNSISVLLEVYDLIPEHLKGEVLSKFSIYMTNQQIKMQIHRLNAEKLFPLIIQMTSGHNKSVLLRHLCNEFVRVNTSIETFLPQFILHYDKLPLDAIREFNSSVRDLLSSNPPVGISIVKKLLENPQTIPVLIRPDICLAIIYRIGNSINQDTTTMIELYMKLRSLDSDENKVEFIKRLFTIAELDKTGAIDPNLQFVLDTLNKFEINELNSKPSQILYEGMKKFMNQMTNENDKFKILQVLLRQANTLSNSKKLEFTDQFLSQIISSLSPDFTNQLIAYLVNSNLSSLYSEILSSNMMSKMSQAAPTNESIQFLLKFIPGEKIDDVVKFVNSQLKNNPAPTIISTSLALKIMKELSPDTRRKISNELIKTAKTRPMPEVIPMLDNFVSISEILDNDEREELVGLLTNWIKGGDPSTSQNSLKYLDKLYFDLNTTTQDSIFDLILNMAKSKSNPNARLFINMLTKNYDRFDSNKKKSVEESIILFLGVTLSLRNNVKITEFEFPNQISDGDTVVIKPTMQGTTSSGFLDLSVLDIDGIWNWSPDPQSWIPQQDNGKLNLAEETYSNTWNFTLPKNGKTGKYFAVMGLYEGPTPVRKLVSYVIQPFNVG